jgi:hypothetical protein
MSFRTHARAISAAFTVLVAACHGTVGGQYTPPAPGGAGGAPGGPGAPKSDAAPGMVRYDAAPGGAPAKADAGGKADAAPVAPPPDGSPGSNPSTNPPAAPPGAWARDVRVSLVEVTQAAFIKLGDGTTVVPPAMRNGPVIEGRPLFARVHVTTGQGFAARKLRAVLSLEYPDHSKFEIEDSKMVSGASNVERLDSTFNFTVPAANVRPSTTLVASVYEIGPATGMDPMPPPRFPASDAADLGVKAGRMELWVVVVPDSPLMDTPERRKKLENDVYDVYPVQKVNFTYHAPVPMMGAFSSAKGFTILRNLREMENAKPYEYYHYLSTATGVGFSGVSNRAGATVMDASRRVGITLVRGNAIDGNTNTVAHELGHQHGRAHAPGCGAAGPDAMYPYMNPPGDMGVNGYSIVFGAFKSRMMWRELMSYCRPRWISDWMWSRFEERVRIVTGFATAAPAMGQMLSARSLQAYAGPGEAADWGIVAGQLVDATAAMTATRYALLRLADGRSVRAPVAVGTMTDDQTREFSVNLTGADYSDGDVVEAEVFIDGQRSLVPVNALYRR